MDQIKICKRPAIMEEVDRWGVPLGTYYVMDIVGFVDMDEWEFIKTFERYNSIPECVAEMEAARKHMESGTSYDLDTPIMKRLMDKAKSTVFQFSMRVHENSTEVSPGSFENEYIRSYSAFGEITHTEWTPGYDLELAKLTKECERLNQKG